MPGLNFDPNQMFFISLAQSWCLKSRDQALYMQILRGVHSPAEFR